MVFIVGAAIFAASLAELDAWADIAVRLSRSDIDPDALSRSGSELFDTLGPVTEFGVTRWGAGLALVAAIGCLLFLRGKTRSGTVLMLLPSVTAAWMSVEWFLVGISSGGAVIHESGPDVFVATAHHFEELRVVSLMFVMIFGLTWAAAHRHMGRALPMVLVGAITSLFACALWLPRPLVFTAIVSLALVSMLIASRGAHLVSRLASAVMAVVGLTAAVPAIAIAHDAAQPIYPAYRYFDASEPTPVVRTKTCLDPLAGPSPQGLSASEMRDELETVQSMIEAQRQPFRAVLKFEQNREWQMRSIVTAVKVLDELTLHRPVLQLLQPRSEPADLWTIGSLHVHACAMNFEIDPDGVPIAGFASIEAMIRAADANGGTLQVRP